TLSFFGSLPRTTNYVFRATILSGETGEKSIPNPLAAAMLAVMELAGAEGESTSTSIVTLRRVITHGLTASVEFKGVLTKTFTLVKKLAASVEFFGALPRNTTRKLTASVEFAGKLNKAFTLTKKLTASVESSGTLGRNT